MATFNQLYPDTELKALSWKQPFASLMLHGKIETRTWETKYRGWVLICASKKEYSSYELLDISGITQTANIYSELLFNLEIPPLGYAIAIGKLVECRPMVKADEDKCFVKYQMPWMSRSKKTGKETLKKLWCHIYEDVQPINLVIWNGLQGFSNVSTEFKDGIHLLR